eukprot:TRINITY_DN63944_c0_g1_i1.p2 TRINITY_DN63944_c0_g1~~TRINITY_DN63944_c0_g1_i1.p2  ORF type:complete len:108 (+),score=22.84 TRINITY_DN63944_c0_g1_i1:104-427(+)
MCIRDRSKHVLLGYGYEDGMALHFMCSMIGGVVASVVTSPVDLAKTRIMNHQSDAGIARTLSDVVRREGAMALYKGFHGQWLRIGPHTTISLMAFENLRHLAGLEYL